MKRAVVLCVLLSGFVPTAWASENAPSVKDIFSHVWHDQQAIVTSPSRMDAADRWLWGATGLSLLVLIPEYNDHQSLDEHINAGIDRDDPPYENFFKRLTYLGDGRVLFGASFAAYGVSSWGDYERAQRFSSHWIEALMDTSLWAVAIKVLAGRNRPESNGANSKFHGPGGYFKDPGANSSFPSGHSAMIFATAAVLTQESDNNLWVGVPAYAVAGGVGFSRMYVEKHWLSDVIFGAVLGQSIGTLVEHRRHTSRQTAFHLEPRPSLDEPGLALVYQW